MGKLLRRKSPDSEQLLAPRKNGLFGKRNNGVRSEDGDQPLRSMSAKRFMTAVFRNGSKQKLDDEAFENLPALQLELFGDNEPHYVHGTPKTAPPSPDLVVLANRPKTNSPNVLNSASKADGDETVMSDLTGTVSPAPLGVPNSSPLRHITPKQQSSPHGVSFANTVHAAPTQDSRYASFSVGVYTDSDDNYKEEDEPKKTDCKSTILEQVLGAVDGACNRTMDMTLSSLQVRTMTNVSTSATTEGGNSNPEWGVAPSVDEESTCFETHDTTTRDTGTYGSSYLCTTRDTTQNTSYKKAIKRMETIVEKGSADAKESLVNARNTWTPRPTEDYAGLHENFELVLGPTGTGETTASGEEPDDDKKSGWTSKFFSSKGEEKKEDDVLEKVNIEKGSTHNGKPPISPYRKHSVHATPSKEQQHDAVLKTIYDDLPLPSPGDVGVEIQSKRAQRAIFAAPSGVQAAPSSPKKKLSNLVKKVKKGVQRARSATTRMVKPRDQAFQDKFLSSRLAMFDSKPRPEEDEKNEIEPMEGNHHKATPGVAKENPSRINLSEINWISLSKPIKLTDKRSNSFKMERPKDSMVEETKLEDPIVFSRLRSAPEKLASSTAKQEATGCEAEQKPLQNQVKPVSILKPPKLHWKAATDEQGRTYYYHRATRKTQWIKPPEFDAEITAVKKYNEEKDAAKQVAAEPSKGCRDVEALQASLRKTTSRDFDPHVWQIKQEILDIVKTMPLPKGTNIEKLLVQYDGREQQLLDNLRDLVESKPFDEPFQAPKREDPPNGPENEGTEQSMNQSQASSVSSAANFHKIDVHKRTRTAMSSTTRVSTKSHITEKTEKIRNTAKATAGIGTIHEFNSGRSTGSISSGSHLMPPREDTYHSSPTNGRVPSRIPVVPRTRDLKVEEFTKDRIAMETYNGAPPPQYEGFSQVNNYEEAANLPDRSERKLSTSTNVAQQIVAMSSLDGDNYNADYDDTADNGDETASENKADSVSALSETDADYLAQKENLERARRKALDGAVERGDWDLAATLSEGMKTVKQNLYGIDEQREWTQTELDRFISENDWDAVSKYIAHMRDTPFPTFLPTRGRDPNTGRDPEGSTPSSNIDSYSMIDPPQLGSDSTKLDSKHFQSDRRLHSATTGGISGTSFQGRPPQTRFGARSQLQHSDLNSISSYDNSSSSYESEYTDGTSESDEQEGYISLRNRRSEFAC